MSIVNLNTVVTYASEPSNLQQSGALISLGATTLATNAYSYCGNLAAVQALIGTGATGNGSEILRMATTFFAQGNGVGLYVLELGAEAAAGDDIPALQTWIMNNPGIFYAFLTPEVWDAVDGVQSVTITNGGSGYTTTTVAATFTAPTSGTTATGYGVVTGGSITSFVITNPGSGYTTAPTVTFVAPATGTTATGTAVLGGALAGIANNYNSPNSQVYFFVTTTQTTVTNYAGNKAVFAVVPSPTALSTEFQCAAPFEAWLLNNATQTMMQPMSFRYMYGVTPWPASGQGSAIATIKAANGNIIESASQAGISTAMIADGTVMSGAQAMSWYGLNFFQIQVQRALAAAVINGSNSQPPLLYDFHGVNVLAGVANSVATQSVAIKAAAAITISATPFATYIEDNPDDYAAGIYGGLSALFTAQQGFLTINFNIDAVQFAG
jgi:hypothetical protein